MLNIVVSKKFRKDLSVAMKRGFDMNLLDRVVDMLANEEKLPAQYQDHALIGEYKEFRECHVKPNWLLIYRVDNEDLELYLFRTGTHSDLFK
ncbi:MAG: type II toxin-antitoxin system YafQ family toxin [Acidaminococcaceae bacterium]|nr:type II toxin-antitoxin system YafQ family toxin [Acidaminococcaceae bacterium]